MLPISLPACRSSVRVEAFRTQTPTARTATGQWQPTAQALWLTDGLSRWQHQPVWHKNATFRAHSTKATPTSSVPKRNSTTITASDLPFSVRRHVAEGRAQQLPKPTNFLAQTTTIPTGATRTARCVTPRSDISTSRA